jgi:hypothetical protein
MHTMSLCINMYNYCIKQKLTLDRGSLGSWVDEDRSKLRVAMWTAGHMIIDMLNAYCALYIWFLHLSSSHVIVCGTVQGTYGWVS